MEEKKTHTRISLQEIEESPRSGVYITSAELRRYGIFGGMLLALLTLFAVFDRKH